MGKVRCLYVFVVPRLKMSAYMQLAVQKQTTIRQIHEDYGLTGDD